MIKWEIVSKINNVIHGVGQYETTYKADLVEGFLYRHVTEDIENEDNIKRRTETMVFVPRNQ